MCLIGEKQSLALYFIRVIIRGLGKDLSPGRRCCDFRHLALVLLPWKPIWYTGEVFIEATQLYILTFLKEIVS